MAYVASSRSGCEHDAVVAFFFTEMPSLTHVQHPDSEALELVMVVLNAYLNSLYFHLQANEQMKEQTQRSSSIIVALTDGELDVYIHELTTEEVNTFQLIKAYFTSFYTIDLNKEIYNMEYFRGIWRWEYYICQYFSCI